MPFLADIVEVKLYLNPPRARALAILVDLLDADRLAEVMPREFAGSTGQALDEISEALADVGYVTERAYSFVDSPLTKARA